MEALQCCYKNVSKRLHRSLFFVFVVNLVINWAQHMNKSTMSLANCIGIVFQCEYGKCYRFSLLAPKNQLNLLSLVVFRAHENTLKMFVFSWNYSLHSFDIHSLWLILNVVLGSTLRIFIFHGATAIRILKLISNNIFEKLSFKL